MQFQRIYFTLDPQEQDTKNPFKIEKLSQKMRDRNFEIDRNLRQKEKTLYCFLLSGSPVAKKRKKGTLVRKVARGCAIKHRAISLSK